VVKVFLLIIYFRGRSLVIDEIQDHVTFILGAAVDDSFHCTFSVSRDIRLEIYLTW
jgi:hypothetical protein